MNEYIDSEGVKHEHIYLVHEDTEVCLKGWYFCDETEDLHGPFGTLEICEELLKKYCGTSLRGKKEILILDIETTGFLQQGGAIVEIGIVSLDLNTGKIEEVFDSLLREDIFTRKHTEKPYGWIFDNSNLTPEDVMEALPADEVFEMVQDVLDSYPLGCTAFNKKFDFSFLQDRGLKITELPCPMLLSTDVCKLLKKGHGGGYKWPKVEEAFKYFYPDVDYTEAHRGLDDARHEAMIVYALYERGIFKVKEIEA